MSERLSNTTNAVSNRISTPKRKSCRTGPYDIESDSEQCDRPTNSPSRRAQESLRNTNLAERIVNRLGKIQGARTATEITTKGKTYLVNLYCLENIYIVTNREVKTVYGVIQIRNNKVRFKTPSTRSEARRASGGASCVLGIERSRVSH